MKRFFVVFLLLFYNLTANAFSPCCTIPCCSTPYYPKWFVLFYLGKMTNDDLSEVVVCDFTFDQDTLYSLEIGKELNPCNPFRQFLQPIVSSVDLRGNITLLDDAYGNIFEFNPYIALNWQNFPWCCYLKTTISFGEGLSYVSKVPLAEQRNSDESQNLLNFLLLEIAFAAPNCPQWEVVARIHHRSGVFGLYNANNSGSTALGIALRYRF